MAADPRLRNLLGALALALADRMRAEAGAATGLTGEAAAALATIAQQPGGSVESLRRAIGRSHPATVRIVDRLAAGGLVERRRARRGPALALTATAAGRARARALLTARARVLDRALGAFGDDDARALEPALERALRALAELPEGIVVCRLCDKGACRRADDCPVVARLEAQGIVVSPAPGR